MIAPDHLVTLRVVPDELSCVMTLTDALVIVMLYFHLVREIRFATIRTDYFIAGLHRLPTRQYRVTSLAYLLDLDLFRKSWLHTLHLFPFGLVVRHLEHQDSLA